MTRARPNASDCEETAYTERPHLRRAGCAGFTPRPRQAASIRSSSRAWTNSAATGIYKYRMEWRQRDRHGGLPQGSRQASARDPERQDRDLFRTSCRRSPRTWKLPEGQGTGDSSDPALRARRPKCSARWTRTAKQYPLEAYGYHGPGRTHSTYHNVPWLRALHPDVAADQSRSTPQSSGHSRRATLVRVFNDRGSLVHPRPRSPPADHSEPRCYARRAHGTGPTRRDVDRGGCFNVLTQLEAHAAREGQSLAHEPRPS
ncbi:MAG: hypothetical protein ACLUNV_04095 [Sutterella wadsworthensis]